MTARAPRGVGSVRVLPSPTEPKGATQITSADDPLRVAISTAEESLYARGLVRLLPGHGELLMGHPVLGHLFTRALTAARAKDSSVRGRAAPWPDGYELTGEWWALPWVAGLLRILRPNIVTPSPRDTSVEVEDVERVLLLAYRDPEARSAMETTTRLLRSALLETGEGTTPQEALVAMARGREEAEPGDEGGPAEGAPGAVVPAEHGGGGGDVPPGPLPQPGPPVHVMSAARHLP